ncbi:hypothetical protein DH2020_027224 [Rehmannia glutinosa]|uniref:Uncharacterized protein n=1 Tax=Rehmannia glutinosa TaxID=99300 RepID=A0ABR0VWM0_REHGL
MEKEREEMEKNQVNPYKRWKRVRWGLRLLRIRSGKSKSSNDIFKNKANNEQKRKLTRQRKLRHVTDDELGLKSIGNDAGPQSCPVSPDSGPGPGSGARTPNHAGGGHWSKSAVPQPLPRPQHTHNDLLGSSVTRFV